MRRVALFLALVIGIGVIVRFSGSWDSLLPAPPLREIDFSILVKPDTPNTYLVCPEAVCLAADPDAPSPVLPVPPGRLLDRLAEIAETDGGVDFARFGENALEIEVRTPLLRWPDLVSAHAYPTTDGGSTLALYSRSVYGESDLGANQARVERWLDRLKD